jgi:hypothetical protein
MSKGIVSSKQDQGVNGIEITPHEMYTRCIARSKEIAEIPYRERVANQMEHLLFMFPLFETRIWPSESGFELLTKALYPFRFSIAPTQAVSLSEWRSQTLLEHLSKQQDRELRWLLVARWLQQERVCEPKQFLPPDLLQRLVKRFQRHMRASEQDFFYTNLIDNWLPYFHRLQKALQETQLRRNREEVTKLGYDSSTVDWALRKRSPIEAVCGWLSKHQKKTGSARTLRNAYTRLHGRQRIRIPKSIRDTFPRYVPPHVTPLE